MSQRNNIVSVYNESELSELHKKFEGSSLDDLNATFDSLHDELEGVKLKLNKKQRQPLIDLLDSNSLYELPFTLSRGALELREELGKGSEIGIGHYRIFQKIYTSTKFRNLAEAKILLDALESTREFNISIAEIEERLKIAAQYISRKELEAQTGLDHKEGDNENRLKVAE